MEGEALARLELQAFWEPAQELGRGCGESGSCRVSPTYCSGSEVWDQENMLEKKAFEIAVLSEAVRKGTKPS